MTSNFVFLVSYRIYIEVHKLCLSLNPLDHKFLNDVIDVG